MDSFSFKEKPADKTTLPRVVLKALHNLAINYLYGFLSNYYLTKTTTAKPVYPTIWTLHGYTLLFQNMLSLQVLFVTGNLAYSHALKVPWTAKTSTALRPQCNCLLCQKLFQTLGTHQWTKWRSLALWSQYFSRRRQQKIDFINNVMYIKCLKMVKAT